MLTGLLSRFKEKRRGPLRMDLNKRYAAHDIGAYTYGRPTILQYPHEGASLTIGKFCSIAYETVIMLGGHHYADWVTTYPLNSMLLEDDELPPSSFSRGNVVIGNDVWIAAQSMILSGTRIGDGAIVGARSLVTKDIPPYAIVAGSPARILRYRFSPSQIEQLLEIAWWDWPIEKIRSEARTLMSPEIEPFVNQHRSGA